jgi:hypothetical protein
MNLEYAHWLRPAHWFGHAISWAAFIPAGDAPLCTMKACFCGCQIPCGEVPTSGNSAQRAQARAKAQLETLKAALWRKRGITEQQNASGQSEKAPVIREAQFEEYG